MPRKAVVLLNGNTLDKQGRGRGAVLIMGGLAAPVGTGLCVGFSGELHISYRALRCGHCCVYARDRNRGASHLWISD